jgi:hypothetical protein
MTKKNLRKCLDIVYGSGRTDLDRLNRIYMKTARKPLDTISESGVVGFKMRFTPPNSYPFHIDGFTAWNEFVEKRFRDYFFASFKRMMFDTLKQHNVTVLMAVRQDLLRWGLSKYHGDGSGRPGHLQFKLARGAISREEIGKITVDCERLEEIISNCETLHQQKRLLLAEFKQAGINAHPVLYEEFLEDKRSYLTNLFDLLELDVTSDEIDRVLRQKEYLKKVHSDDISEFVENHEVVTQRFADRLNAW